MHWGLSCPSPSPLMPLVYNRNIRAIFASLTLSTCAHVCVCVCVPSTCAQLLLTASPPPHLAVCYFVIPVNHLVNEIQLSTVRPLPWRGIHQQTPHCKMLSFTAVSSARKACKWGGWLWALQDEQGDEQAGCVRAKKKEHNSVTHLWGDYGAWGNFRSMITQS